jgi:predicted esterase
MNFTGYSGSARFIGVILITLFITIAQAADKVSICDGEAPGGLGLCQNYCEHLDCDWDPGAPQQACAELKLEYSGLTGESEFPCETKSPGCMAGDSGQSPPFPFEVGDGNNYGQRTLGLTVPGQCSCEGTDCVPCPVVVGFHGYGQDENHWKSRLEPKGAAAGFISLYPVGDKTRTTYDPTSSNPNWAVPSCQDPDDGCLHAHGTQCDWCGSLDEEDALSTDKEIAFTRAIIKWTMDNHCVDPGQVFATGYSNGGVWSHFLAGDHRTSGLFKALVPMDGITQAGLEDPLKWVSAPVSGDSPWVLHVNEIFDNWEPYDGRPYTEPDEPSNPVWIYPPVLQIFAGFLPNPAYSDCGFDMSDKGDRHGILEAGGIVPAGYRRLNGPGSLEGEGQELFRCFTKDAEGKTCRKLAVCLWDGGEPGDDLTDPHSRAGREWAGGVDPGLGGTGAMDIMWRFFQRSVNDDD